MSSAAADTRVRVSVLEDFEHPTLDRARWNRLVADSVDLVFMTLDWQREWWRAFGSERERLLIVLAERDREQVAVAPLFVAKETLFLVGSDGSDYLDFVGRVDAPTLAAMLDAARARLDDFMGIGLYHVPYSSRTTALLPRVAELLDLALHQDGEGGAPYADLTDSVRVEHLLARRTLRKALARMRRAGSLRARVATRAELDAWLELFLAQHALLWPGDDGLQSEESRAFCHGIVHAGQRDGWLRFTMLEWKERPVAFEITLIHGRTWLSYVGSRDTAADAYSPGAVLQAHIVGDALAAGARRYDFGLGEEPYKLADASGTTRVANWFMYPR